MQHKPKLFTGSLYAAGIIIILQFASLWSVYWVTPDKNLECGMGGGALWAWKADEGTFPQESGGLKFRGYIGWLQTLPEFRRDVGYQVHNTDAVPPIVSTISGWQVTFPVFWVLLLTGTGALIGYRSWRGDRRARRGLCSRCAYALDLLPRCPECGLAPEPLK